MHRREKMGVPVPPLPPTTPAVETKVVMRTPRPGDRNGVTATSCRWLTPCVAVCGHVFGPKAGSRPAAPPGHPRDTRMNGPGRVLAAPRKTHSRIKAFEGVPASAAIVATLMFVAPEAAPGTWPKTTSASTLGRNRAISAMVPTAGAGEPRTSAAHFGSAGPRAFAVHRRRRWP